MVRTRHGSSIRRAPSGRSAPRSRPVRAPHSVDPRLQSLRSRNVLVEREFLLTTLDPVFSSVIGARHWTSLCDPPLPSINRELLAQFYFQFDPHSDEFEVEIFGTSVTVGIESIRSVLPIPISDGVRGRISIPLYDPVVLARALTGDDSISFSFPERSFPVGHVTTLMSLWHRFVCHNLHPTGHTQTVISSRGNLIFYLSQDPTEQPLDACAYIFHVMRSYVSSASPEGMPYASLVHRLCFSQGVRIIPDLCPIDMAPVSITGPVREHTLHRRRGQIAGSSKTTTSSRARGSRVRGSSSSQPAFPDVEDSPMDEDFDDDLPDPPSRPRRVRPRASDDHPPDVPSSSSGVSFDQLSTLFQEQRSFFDDRIQQLWSQIDTRFTAIDDRLTAVDARLSTVETRVLDADRHRREDGTALAHWHHYQIRSLASQQHSMASHSHSLHLDLQAMHLGDRHSTPVPPTEVEIQPPPEFFDQMMALIPYPPPPPPF